MQRLEWACASWSQTWPRWNFPTLSWDYKEKDSIGDQSILRLIIAKYINNAMLTANLYSIKEYYIEQIELYNNSKLISN